MALWVIAVVVVAAAFALGWLVGRKPADTAPAPSVPIEVRLNTSALSLMPDGGITLPPLPSTDVEDLLDPADAGTP